MESKIDLIDSNEAKETSCSAQRMKEEETSSIRASRHQIGSNTNISSASSSSSSSSSGIQSSSSYTMNTSAAVAAAAMAEPPGQQQHHHKSSISSSSSSMLTNSTSSPAHTSMQTTTTTTTATKSMGQVEEQQTRQCNYELAAASEDDSLEHDDIGQATLAAPQCDVAQQQQHPLGLVETIRDVTETKTMDLLEQNGAETEEQLTVTTQTLATLEAAPLESQRHDDATDSSRLGGSFEAPTQRPGEEFATSIEVLDGGHRLERSNSCSQAQCATNSVSLAAIGDQAGLVKAGSISLSQDNLATTISETISQQDVKPSQDLPAKQLEEKQATRLSSKQQQQQQQSSSSRFFSSKLNTGSLWSLLSTGSTNSTNMSDHQQHLNDDSIHSTGDSYRNESTAEEHTLARPQSFTSSTGNFLSRYQFKMPISTSSSTSFEQHKSASQSAQPTTLPADTQDRRRFRFNVKYIGSALLHKNFTLPMLEWIAKDIRRQTIRGAQSTSQRQFTIPTREIIFEIQFNQLRAISCKDGHCKFVHPMHCVSKYVQLQHDPTSFAYIIRDTKESQNFCHVFQAKSANKVHDIFSAIRETAKSSGQPSNPQQLIGVNNRLQKSASTDGHWKSLLTSSASVEPSNVASKQPPSSPSAPARQPQQPQRGGSTPTTPIVSSSKSMFAGDHRPSAVAPTPGPATTAASNSTQSMVASNKSSQEAAIQFENSYQFEVMFVKRVKLQCRRVPPTFVDDALETLKSFEVLKADSKSSQIKSGVVGAKSRIINASVDERQEYDESCQSPTLTSSTTTNKSLKSHLESAEEQRRGSSASLNKRAMMAEEEGRRKSNEERESKSCQQSPAKGPSDTDNPQAASHTQADVQQQASGKHHHHHQSVDCLKSLDEAIRTSKSGQPPTYTNDFSPYNTITCSDLNERIAAIPVVSSSVSLDHETRQRLARQVRETIQATAANIKKGVYASGDKLDSTTSSKALDSLSCTATVSSMSLAGQHQQHEAYQPELTTSELLEVAHQLQQAPNRDAQQQQQQQNTSWARQQQQSSSIVSNNFDLFRRASARQVVKNRTMLLLIGKDELCAISIDKHQILFSKSFNSIVHCLQGNSNRDHFGLICRDSGKVNPMTESYVGYVFKCQSEKVVREIMGTLKQVIYSSQHNYHGFNSPYNPLNSILGPTSTTPAKKQPNTFEQLTTATNTTPSSVSLADKRGFSNRHIELDLSGKQIAGQLTGRVTSKEATGVVPTPPPPPPPPTAPVLGHTANSSLALTTSQQQQLATMQKKNPIKSMFCDNCPLYWYHRLCCDVESMPAEASKTIILRRIDSSLSDKEQDEIYSRFSEFNIESIEEHNEIFMSILRHQSERKQLKHNSSQSHLAAIAKNNLMLARQSSSSGPSMDGFTVTGPTLPNTDGHQSRAMGRPAGGHQRSGSTSGSLAFVLNQTSSASAQAAGQSIADASSVAIDNLKRAKNSISVSIENMLKRRSSMKDEQLADEQQPPASALTTTSNTPVRSGSFKSNSRESRANESNSGASVTSTNNNNNNLKRSQSTTDYSQSVVNQLRMPASWRDSLTRTINETELSNPLANLFGRRRGSQSRDEHQADDENNSKVSSSVASNENLASSRQSSQHHSPSRPKTTGSLTPSSMLPGVFWKKSIFDKIKQPVPGERSSPISPTPPPAQTTSDQQPVCRSPEVAEASKSQKRSKQELRLLWRKAILEQITLLKMDKQNQKLQATANVECNIQRIKLNYRDVLFGRDAIALWDRLLRQDPTKKVDFAEVSRLVRLGLPKQRRGEVWMFLMNQYQLRHGTSFQPADSEYRGDANQTYRSLLSQLSTQQHEIFVDIGKYDTFRFHN